MDTLTHLKGCNEYGTNLGLALIMLSMNEYASSALKKERGLKRVDTKHDTHLADLENSNYPMKYWRTFKVSYTYGVIKIGARMSGPLNSVKFFSNNITGTVEISILKGKVPEIKKPSNKAWNICHFLKRRNSCPENGDFYISGPWDKPIVSLLDYILDKLSIYNSSFGTSDNVEDLEKQLIYEYFKKYGVKL